jgi:hypothetical protein
LAQCKMSQPGFRLGNEDSYFVIGTFQFPVSSDPLSRPPLSLGLLTKNLSTNGSAELFRIAAMMTLYPLIGIIVILHSGWPC